MKALVTGGGGFVGSAIARALQRRGDEVLVLGRRHYPDLERAGIRTMQADLRDRAAVESACSGVEVAFHAGAVTGIWGPRALFWETNLEGTRHVLEGCRRHGVARLVYTSSPSVVFGDQPLAGADESQPYAASFLTHYPQTKAAAERLVLAASGPSLATVALRPHLVWGPGDPHLIPRVVGRARRGHLVQVGDGRNLVDITYIDNAVQAHLLAADALAAGRSCAGRAYFISQGEPVELWPWLNDILQRLGIPPVRRAMSYAAARRLGGLLEFVHGALHIRSEPRMTRFLACQLAMSHYFDISAARRDLGYAPAVSTAEGVERLLGWLKSSDSSH